MDYVCNFHSNILVRYFLRLQFLLSSKTADVRVAMSLTSTSSPWFRVQSGRRLDALDTLHRVSLRLSAAQSPRLERPEQGIGVGDQHTRCQRLAGDLRRPM